MSGNTSTGIPPYSREAEETTPSLVIMSHQIGIKDFDPGRPMSTVKRFGVLGASPN
jgi:hypothetical protein